VSQIVDMKVLDPCGPQVFESASCRVWRRTVFMVKPAENRARRHVKAVGKPVSRSVLQTYRFDCWGIGHSRAQRHMRATTVVMRDPTSQEEPEVVLVERYHPVEKLSSQCPDESFAERICLGGSIRGLQHAQAQVANGFVECLREDAVAIVTPLGLRPPFVTSTTALSFSP
jgi:hypothetical protein